MSRVLLLQLDGTGANLALMRLAAHHRGLGDHVEFRRAFKPEAVAKRLWDNFDHVYASTIFERTKPVVDRLKQVYPNAIIGGTGLNLTTTLEEYGIPTRGPIDYSDYPELRASLGFSQRGCRLDCPFCVVRRKEGKAVDWNTIAEIYRGDPHPRWIQLLDNDFFGAPSWRKRIAELQEGRFKVCFNQGINSRMLTDEASAAIASVDYRDDSFKAKRIYTAWDSKPDEDKLFRGLNNLVKYGVKPDEIMVYVLIGYDPNETAEDREYRRKRLREFGARPYPMPFVRTPELVGFQRWVTRRQDFFVPWAEFVKSGYRPEKFGHDDATPLFGEAS